MKEIKKTKTTVLVTYFKHVYVYISKLMIKFLVNHENI